MVNNILLSHPRYHPSVGWPPTKHLAYSVSLISFAAHPMTSDAKTGNFLARSPRSIFAIFFSMCEGSEAPPGFWGETATPLLLRAAFKCVQQMDLLISMLFAARVACISLTNCLPDTVGSPDPYSAALYFKAAAVEVYFKHS